MTFLEWRRFNFFDLEEDKVTSRLQETLSEVQIETVASGNGYIAIADNNGYIYLIDRSHNVASFKAYAVKTILLYQIETCQYLFTIGEDESGCNPLIKIWNLDKRDKQGNPFCTRISRVVPSYKAVVPTTIHVHTTLTLMAIGFEDGSIMLYRGDLTRERKNKIKVLKDSSMAITGLSFCIVSKKTYLYAATSSSVYLYNISIKDKESKIVLDTIGCSQKCCVFVESKQNSHFMIGRNDAIYCYTLDGRGPCYAIEGQKIMLDWFRNYLIIISKEKDVSQVSQLNLSGPSIQTTSAQPKHDNTITILDIKNKFIVFSKSMSGIQAILQDWGGLYLLTLDQKIYRLEEKDIISKLTLLFKKNLYDVAIRIAKSHNYDAEGLVDIFCQYGDHLYLKGDFNGATEQYIKTIGILEPSYVIRKFSNSQHTDCLIMYLQALHKNGCATESHTTLLLNCYTKLNYTDELKNFIMSDDRQLDFDVDVAIKVCRRSLPEYALLLAQKHMKHEWYLRIQVENKKQYEDALNYIETLTIKDQCIYAKKYGRIFIENIPQAMTQFLKVLCTKYLSLQAKGTEPYCSAHPEDFVHLYFNDSRHLIEFLEFVIQSNYKLGSVIYNTLIEHYLSYWSLSNDKVTVSQYEEKLLKLLESSYSTYDKEHVFILCQRYDFSPGILFLHEKKNQYKEILQYYIQKVDNNKILSTCNTYGRQDPDLWVQVLWSIASKKNASPSLLKQALHHITENQLMSPLTVLDVLSTSSTSDLGDVRSYLDTIIRQEYEKVQGDEKLTIKFKTESNNLRQRMHSIQKNVTIFQGSRCSACHHQLELPSVHFLCQHSYHQHCFQSFSESENECPACLPSNKKWLDMMKIQEQSVSFHESFHSLLDKSEEPFSLVADYFSKSVFKKVTLIADWQNAPTIAKPKDIKPAVGIHNSPGVPSYNVPLALQAIKSDKISLSNSENSLKAKNSKLDDLSTLKSFTEPKVSQSSSKSEAVVHNLPKKTNTVQTSKSESSAKQAVNPFDEDYDESKNPFADDYASDQTQ